MGRDRTCLTIPKCLAKDLSDPLHEMMNNEHMKEAREGRANLEDVDESVFVGFCEFAYTGDYRSRAKEGGPEVQSNDDTPCEEEPAPEVAAPEEEPMAIEAQVVFDAPTEIPVAEYATPPAPELDDIWGPFGGKKKDKKKRNKGYEDTIPTRSSTEQLWYDFNLLLFNDSIGPNEQPASLNSNQFILHTPTASLLYHAKMYVFAQKYVIHNLRILALRNLHVCLRNLDLTKRDTGDILEILEFTYTNTERGESNDDDLRKLIVHYAACKADILKQNPDLRGLLEEYAELACDLFYKS